MWQSTGFVIALFLAGLRGVDDEIIKAAQVDGASMPTIYRRVVLPSMRPVFFSVLVILSHLTIKTFDLVVALTARRSGHLVLSFRPCSCTRSRSSAGGWASALPRR